MERAVCAFLISTAFSGGVAYAASMPLALSGRALSEAPSMTERAQPLAEQSVSCGPRWIIYLPDGGFSHQPARISHAYRVDMSRAVLFVSPPVLK